MYLPSVCILLLLFHQLGGKIIDVKVFNGTQYARLSDSVNFSEAKLLCENLKAFQGATLFKPLNKNKLFDILHISINTGSYWLDYERENIALNDSDPLSYGILTDSDLAVAGKNPWADDFPEDENNIRRCIANFGSTVNGERIYKLKNTDCTSKKLVFCEREFVNETITTRFTIESKEYALVKNLENFTQASNTCSTLDSFPEGQLVKINSTQVHDNLHETIFPFVKTGRRDIYSGYHID